MQVPVRMHESHLRARHAERQLAASRAHERRDRCGADRQAVLIEDEDGVQRLCGSRGRADRLQRFGDGRRGGHRDEVRVHHPARGVRVVREEVSHLGLLRRGQVLQDRKATVLIDLIDEVGGVVGLHARENSRRVHVGARLEELQLVGHVELLEDVRLQLAVQPDGLDDLLALLVARLLDEVGDLGGMQLGQFAVGNA